MNYTEFAFGRFESEIAAVAKQFELDLQNLEIELFTPNQQAIFVEAVGSRRFRIHLSLEGNRIIAVKQVAGEPIENSSADLFAKYTKFMK
ncbi:MAG: hypothetical protein ONA90_03500 [candidate division KSB1 bacterium]|nr:hypothetical protein [candidate division KSB1 bacterium]